MSAIGTDTAFSTEENIIFQTLGEANVDRHPNAHASRIKISSVTVDSPVKVPWDITNEFAAYVGKIKHVSVTCHLPHHEESQLLEEQCITDVSDPRFDPRVYTEYDITMVKNRMHYLRALDAGLSVRSLHLALACIPSA